MSQITLENVPESLIKKVGTTADFSSFLGLYWDGMDWCQYNEVIPSKEDIIASRSYDTDLSDNNGKDFLDMLQK